MERELKLEQAGAHKSAKTTTAQFFVLATLAFDRSYGFQRRLSVCLFVRLFLFSHNISKTDAA